MSRALVPAKLIKPPKELEQFLDDPPLVGTERREDYDNFFSMIAMAAKPVDAIDWLIVIDIAYLSWEIRRERRIKAEIIKLRQREAQSSSDMAMMRAGRNTALREMYLRSERMAQLLEKASSDVIDGEFTEAAE